MPTDMTDIKRELRKEPPEWFARALQEARIKDWWNRQPWYVKLYLECRRRLGMQPPKWAKIS